MECMKCGMSLGSHQVHPEEQCNRQQEINRGNLGVTCRWCGHQAGDHKDGCPRKALRTGRFACGFPREDSE